jgi:transposase InsO family protein
MRRMPRRDFIGALPVNAVIHPAGLPINTTSTITVLRGPVESSQYVALGFGQQARDAGIAVSMGSRGDCYDNAVAESFFATIKKELVHRQPWPSRRDPSSAVFEYIEAFYNRHRRHSTLGYLSPEEYEHHNHNTKES